MKISVFGSPWVLSSKMLFLQSICQSVCSIREKITWLFKPTLHRTYLLGPLLMQEKRFLKHQKINHPFGQKLPINTVALPEIRGEKDSLPFHMLSMVALYNHYGTT